jgi:hypothetical protein
MALHCSWFYIWPNVRLTNCEDTMAQGKLLGRFQLRVVVSGAPSRCSGYSHGSIRPVAYSARLSALHRFVLFCLLGSEAVTHSEEN